MFTAKGKIKADVSRVRSSTSHVLPDLKRELRWTEQRRAQRKGLWCVCLIATEAAPLREAIILDVSRTGARIRFRSKGRLPAKIMIKASRIGLNRGARVVWQTSFDAGIEFIPGRLGAA